jgi:hypothetical protein
MDQVAFSYPTAWLVFGTYILVDIMYAYYIICVEKRRALRAAMVSSVLYSLLAFGVVSYSQNIWYLVPLACGAFIGTFITVWLKRRDR